MLLLVLNQPVTIYAKQIMALMSLSDCITSYDKKKIDEMLSYYESKGSKNISLNELLFSYSIDALNQFSSSINKIMPH
jgi:hypothetical protein